MTATRQRAGIGAQWQRSPQLLLAGIETLPSAFDALFFALRPTAAAAARIAAIAECLRTRSAAHFRPIASARMHVSLQGFGRYVSVPEEIVRRASAAAARVSATPFTLALDRIETFGRGEGPRPLVLTASDGAVRLHEFHERLGLALATAGLRSPATRVYTPHLTLAYVRDVVPGRHIEPVAWTVDEFLLVRSMQGRGKHLVAGCWRLAEG